MRRTETIPENTYSNPFCKGFFADAGRALRSTRILTTSALLCAVCAVVDAFYIPVGGPFLRIQFSFLFAAVLNLIAGPWLALPAGFIVDLLSFFCAGGDPAGYFPGYAVSSMLAFLIYAMFLFRAKLSFSRIFLSRLVVDVFVNVIVGSVWKHLLYGKAYRVYFISGAVKNLTLLPLEAIVMAFLLSRLVPVMRRLGLIPSKTEVTVTKRDIVISVIGAVVGTAILVWYYFYTTKG